jgi:hypothetical protein
MRNTNLFLLLVCILLFLSFFFYTIEGLQNPNTDDDIIIQLKSGPVDKVAIEYYREYGALGRGAGGWNVARSDSYLDLREFEIRDKEDALIRYWIAPNTVTLTGIGGNTVTPWGGPIRNLWDGSFDTNAHSATAPAELVVTLSPPKEITRVQITMVGDNWVRLRNFRLVLYQNNEVVGTKSLATRVAFPNGTLNYWVIPALGQSERGDKGINGVPGIKGIPGPKGDKGKNGPQGDKGDKGIPGEKGDKGITGDKGEIGDDTAMGPKGDKGNKGDKGERGEKGERGPKGIEGPQGIDGMPGNTGNYGAVGDKGYQGIDGKRFGT